MMLDIKAFLEKIPNSLENELIEFKLASEDYDTKMLCNYVSALANEANLNNSPKAFLVLGVEPKKHQILGTRYKIEPSRLQGVKHQVYQSTQHSIDVYDVIYENHRVVIFEIPSAPQGKPIDSNGHYWAREGESLVALSDNKRDTIRHQINTDWSNIFTKHSSIQDLDGNAVSFLRQVLKTSSGDNSWLEDSLEKVLSRMHLINETGELNNTALLFLGKHETIISYLPSDLCRITWRYTDVKNDINERTEIFPPFLLGIEKIIMEINRFNVIIGDISLFREDIRQYDQKSIEELLINSLVHRDWSINMWNEVIQTPEMLEFRNPGKFRANLNQVLLKNYVKDYAYPNLGGFLTKLKLMERERRGLEKVFNNQLRKGLSITTDFLPERTSFILGGKIKNAEFAKIVLKRSDIPLEQLLILDRLIDGPSSLEDEEYLKVKDYVEKQKRVKRYFIKTSFLQGNDIFDEHFLESHSSLKTKEQVFLDFAKKNNGKITTINCYKMFPNDPSSSIRYILMKMENNDILERIGRGEYRIQKKQRYQI